MLQFNGLKTSWRRLITCFAHPICHNFPMCGRYRLSRRKQIVEAHFSSFSSVSGGEDWTLATILPLLSLSRLFARIRRSPSENCRYFVRTDSVVGEREREKKSEAGQATQRLLRG